MKIYRRSEPQQSLLFPPSPLEWVLRVHLSRLILDVVKQLDLSAIYAQYERKGRTTG